jgi:chorismate lyase / 3-hydroxybenzoate synthase
MPYAADGTEIFVSSPLPGHTKTLSLADSNHLHLLGHITFGLQRRHSNHAVAAQHVFCQPLHAPALVGTEQWFSRQTLQPIQIPGVHGYYNNDVVFGVIELPEPAETSNGLRPLEQAAQTAYKLLFETLDQYQYPYLWRAWNYMADITQVTHGLERYQQFNAGRQLGFAASARQVTGNVPAACAIGVRSGPLSVAFLAGRSPTVAIENPRQISAYHYPDQYGVLRPTFSRASLATLGQQELFLLSGTASIVGHETVHIGNVQEQTIETLRNIQTVMAQANLASQSPEGYQLRDLQLRAYVRHAQDMDTVRDVLSSQLGDDSQVLYLNADICRHNLDIEIEGIAWKTISPT